VLSSGVGIGGQLPQQQLGIGEMGSGEAGQFGQFRMVDGFPLKELGETGGAAEAAADIVGNGGEEIGGLLINGGRAESKAESSGDGWRIG